MRERAQHLGHALAGGLMTALLVACGSTASAQPSAVADLTEIRRLAGIHGEGPLAAAVRHEAARLAQDAASVPPATASQGWIGRHPVVVGALIGTGTGVALSRTDAIGGANHDPRVALVGAGVGAWGGLIASAVHKVRAKEKVSVGMKIGIVAGAVALAVVPVLAYSAARD